MGLNATYLRNDPSNVQRHINFLDTKLPNGYQLFQDYLIMYESIVNPESALQDFQALPEEDIDGGNSRTAGLVWIYDSLNN